MVPLLKALSRAPRESLRTPDTTIEASPAAYTELSPVLRTFLAT